MYNNTRSRRGGFGRRPRRSPRSSSIHPDRYVSKAVDKAEEVLEVATHKFSDFNFDKRLSEIISARDYHTPTPIQDKAIKPVMAGRDVIGIAETGTGKTAAFLLPLIHRLLSNHNEKTLIIVPTRELAVQIESELRLFSTGLRINSALCIGGAGYGSQIQSLRRNPQFIIGTPGRLLDHLQRKTLYLDRVKNLVLDEADRMVEMGFIEDIRQLIAQTPSNRQSLFFSATITPEVNTLIGEFTDNPEVVSVKKRDTSKNIEQDVVKYTDNFHKMSLLHNLLIKEDCNKVLIFGRTKHGVEKLTSALIERGFSATSIHGNKTQPQRQRALNDFKQNRVQILVATDVAARGLDIPNVSHVINFDTPENYADYVHRIGRTGRADKLGTALTFVSATS